MGHTRHGLGRPCPHPELGGAHPLVDEIGFLPLFQNEIDGFSVEENTAALAWWTGDPDQDPWEWRTLITRNGRVAYDKPSANEPDSSPIYRL